MSALKNKCVNAHTRVIYTKKIVHQKNLYPSRAPPFIVVIIIIIIIGSLLPLVGRKGKGKGGDHHLREMAMAPSTPASNANAPESTAYRGGAELLLPELVAPRTSFMPV
jgi:hypothetical protein